MAYTKPGQTRNRIYQFVRNRLLQGRPPSVREVQEAFQMRSVQSAKSHLNALVREGRLTQEPGKARSYRLPGKAHPARRFAPLVGDVPAGRLNAALENIEGYILIHSRYEEDAVFALRVRGDSMIDGGILDGDIVIVHRDAQPRSGDIVVALVDDEATVKELRLGGGEVQLRPRNAEYPILTIAAEQLTLLGKVIEVRRFLEGVELIEEAQHA